jgi:hypothetical protein
VTIKQQEDGCAMCDGATYAEVLQMYKENIEKHGYTVVFVGGDKESRPFAYTIGLTEKGYPELIVSGHISAKTAYTILSIACQHTLYKQEEIPLGLNSSLYTIRTDFQSISPQMVEAYMGQAVLMYGNGVEGKRVRGTQIVWADINNKLPYEEGFNPDCSQTMLKNQLH